MKLTFDANPAVNVIRRYSPQELVVGTTTLHRPCIISADRIVEDWQFQSIQTLSADELKPILDLEPEVILLGTGSRQIFPPPALMAFCLARRIALEPMDLGAACRTFNVLVQEDRPAVGAFVIGV